MRATGTFLGCLLLVCASTSCGPDRPSGAQLQSRRCLAAIDLHQLIESSGVARGARTGWGVSGGETGLNEQLFDREHSAVLPATDSGALTAALCHRLREQLGERCKVRQFWAGRDHCAALLEPRRHGDSASPAFAGRIHLFAVPKAEGSVEVVLTGTEWVN
ncbi:MAG TPA: hypothetical protein VEG34_07830 [Thermoanaerobaculia bacterium]|nr:hypothetical protein [Thermoanaerobaculia bacterium]